jgi:hypothetical protein
LDALPHADALTAALAGLAEWWLRPGPSRDAAISLVSESTGWPVPHAAEAVRRAFSPYTPGAIAGLVRAGSGPGPRPGHLLAVLAGRVPAVAANALFWSLAARVPVVLKPSSAEPEFARLLVASVRAVAAVIAPHVALLDVPSSDRRPAEAVRDAPVCLAYGSDASVAAVAALRPGLPTLVGAHRESFVLAFADALRDESAARRLAAAVADDVAIYDQSGCLSPHCVLVERCGIPPQDFAALLRDELARAALRIPPAAPPIADVAGVRMFVEESRALGGRVLPGPTGIPPAVVLLPPGAPARPAPGLRVVQILPFEGEPDLAALLPNLAGRVQGIAVAGDRSRTRPRAAAAFAAHPSHHPSRVCAPGRLQRPPAAWPENGVLVTRCLAIPSLAGTRGRGPGTRCRPAAPRAGAGTGGGIRPAAAGAPCRR